MEEFKFYKKSHSKLILNIILTLFGGLLVLAGYAFYANNLTFFAVIFWLMAVVIIGLALYICFSNIRLYNDRIEIKNFITKTTYFKDVSTLDIVGYNLIFRDSDQEALLALPIQNIVLDLTALLNFIRKHNPHVQLGASFIPEDKISEIIGQEDGDS